MAEGESWLGEVWDVVKEMRRQLALIFLVLFVLFAVWMYFAIDWEGLNLD
jgi:hypothetical protein